LGTLLKEALLNAPENPEDFVPLKSKKT